ncbi:hypothetical protein ACRAWC_09450 [Leifsonia sp. L25]|uniref:hypothetical protein n=1 Tax=Actinomycetes TaxID=1760 RepID=UPI003D68EBC6
MTEVDEAQDGAERAEVMVRFREHYSFLMKSAREFDAGDHSEALRMALSVRTISYDDGPGDSALLQLGAKREMLWRSFYIPPALDIPEDTPEIGSSLHGIAYAADGSTYLEPLDFGPDGRYVPYDDWWTGEPVVQFGDASITRKQLVLGLANQDGGAHVDLAGHHISALFAGSPTFLSRDGAEKQRSEQRASQRDLLQIQMRAVASEVLHSINRAEQAGLIHL